MAISKTAERNHDVLFPGHVSALKQSDPEFIEFFDNFAFDEVIAHDNLDIRLRVQVQLASLIACHAQGEYRVMADAALNVGVSPVQIKEIVYQAVAYVGIGRVFDFLHITNDVLRGRGVELPLRGQSTTSSETRMACGLATQKRIIGDALVARLYDSAPEDMMHIQRYLTGNCFGDYYTREGMDIRTRELITFSMLIALGGCDAQVRAHVTANLHVGNDRAMLISVATQLLPYIGYPRTLNAIGAIDEVTLEKE
jgi:4-carboxymuconolactone decarboxylase